MNWNKIAIHGFALFLVQVLSGVLEGFFLPAGSGQLIASSLVSFVLCGLVFAHFSIRQTNQPFVHAGLALAIYFGLGKLFSAIINGRLGSTPPTLVALEWSVVILALLAGTAAGIAMRHGRIRSADV